MIDSEVIDRPDLREEPARKKRIMEHTLTAEGFGTRLRPVRMDDAAFIVWLRNWNTRRGGWVIRPRTRRASRHG